MLRVVKNHDRPPDLLKLLQANFVQKVLFLQISVGDSRILPPQGEHELHVDVRLHLLNVQNRLHGNAQEYFRLVSCAFYGRSGIVCEVGVIDRYDVTLGLIRAVWAVVLSITSERVSRAFFLLVFHIVRF